jgi:hypothetical protein
VAGRRLHRDFAGAAQDCRAGAREGLGEHVKVVGEHRERDESLGAADFFGGHHQHRAATDGQHRARTAVHRDFFETEM